MVCCDANFKCYNSSGTVVFSSWIPSSCCHTRKDVAVILLNCSFPPFWHNENDHCVEGACARSLFRAAFLLCGWICYQLLPKLSPIHRPSSPFYSCCLLL